MGVSSFSTLRVTGWSCWARIGLTHPPRQHPRAPQQGDSKQSRPRAAAARRRHEG